MSHQLSLLGAVQSLCLSVCSPSPFHFSNPQVKRVPLGTWGPLLWLLLQPPGFPGSSRCCLLTGHEIPPVKHLQETPWALSHR